ncbi:MAG: hypothetical protein C0500_05350 [Sphingobium sp.]|nr:hypothetical protein [Sphingobium sp.]
MGPLHYVMAILGCGDGEQACAEARIVPVRYPSITACQMAMPTAIVRNSDIDYPVIAASCREAGVRMADRRTGTNRRARS